MSNQSDSRQEKIKEYLKNLEKLGNGEKAALKRSIGQTLSNADGNALSAFYKAMPYDSYAKQENAFFLIGTFVCYWKDIDDSKLSFVECLRKIRDESDSLDRKVIALLDTDFSEQEDYFVGKLSRLIRMIKQKGYKPDFNELLNDLLLWNLENRSIQRKWARAYFGYINFDKNKEEK